MEECKQDKFSTPKPPPSKYATFKLNPIKPINKKLLKNGYSYYTISELDKLKDPLTNLPYTKTDFTGLSINKSVKKIGGRYESHYHRRFDYLNVEDETGHKSKLDKVLNSKKYLQYLQIKYTYVGWNSESEMAKGPY